MSENIACICGYHGPSVPGLGGATCPICGAQPSGSIDSSLESATPQRPKTYSIPCPKGHLLTVSETMLDEQDDDWRCPTCSALFVLRITDSLEYRKQQKQRQEEREDREAQIWLKRAIWAAVLVVASLIGMIALSLVYRSNRAANPASSVPASRLFHWT